MNRTISLLYGNFHMMGYYTAHINTECGIIDIMHIIRNNELYMIPIIVSQRGITAEITMRAVDVVRQKIISSNPGINAVHVLQLVISCGDMEHASLSSFFPYWIIDMNELRLIVYESQPVDFYNLRMIVENTLDGTECRPAGSENVSMRSEIRGFPLITAVIVLINVLVFIVMELGGSTLDTEYMLSHGALKYSEVFIQGQYYRLFTHFFMHFGLEHIINNMFVFIVLGYHLENIIGKWWYLCIYMTSGFLSGIVSVIWYNILGEQCVSAGASGAIFGIIGALFVLIIIYKGRLRDISYRRIILFLILTLYSGARNPEVDNAAHVSGFVIGSVLMLVIYGLRHAGIEGTVKGDR